MLLEVKPRSDVGHAVGVDEFDFAEEPAVNAETFLDLATLANSLAESVYLIGVSQAGASAGETPFIFPVFSVFNLISLQLVLEILGDLREVFQN